MSTNQATGTVTSETFRPIISNFATGVSIITVRHNKKDYGLTASAVCSVSLDPPMLLICVNQNTGTQKAIMEAGSFNVHILGKQQGELALKFSKANTDKFEDLVYSYSDLGNPLFPNVVAQIECQLYKEMTGGTHSVFLGKVHSAKAITENPLLYLKGQFGEFTHLKLETFKSKEETV
ncbi:flavin reductase family protein [Peribacillus sp. NPDC097295]|uniref:flavin reductase family protein n=1 Tax=Peribacillus sp. NPDC097295 TaxID=3364402 RepID=UPI00382F6D0B